MDENEMRPRTELVSSRILRGFRKKDESAKESKE